MASKTLSAHGYPAGTSVSAYPRRALVNGGPPTGAALDTSTVASDESLTFDGLTEGEGYVAWGAGRPVSFFVEEEGTRPELADRGRIVELERDRDETADKVAALIGVAPPTGVMGADDAAWVAALAEADAAGGGLVVAQPGTYVISFTAKTPPDNTTIVIPSGCTVKMGDNLATADAIYRAFDCGDGANIHFRIDGVLDGNRRGGNESLNEYVFPVMATNVQGFSMMGTGEVYDWRGDGLYVGHQVGQPIPSKLRVGYGLTFRDCGLDAGAPGNARQGVAFVAANDCIVEGAIFDGIGGYAVDFEGNAVGDNFDAIVVGSNSYRDCGQGTVNLTTPGTIGTVTIDPGRLAGTLPTANISPIPTNQARVVQKRKTNGNVTINTANSATWMDVAAGTGANQLDIVLPGQPGDIIEVSLSTMWGNEAVFAQLDVVTWVSGAVASSFSANGAATPLTSGILAWKGINGVERPVGGTVQMALGSEDISGGTVTLRLRASTNSAVNKTLNAATDTALTFGAKNLGPGW
jgi:hypothetical protein